MLEYLKNPKLINRFIFQELIRKYNHDDVSSSLLRAEIFGRSELIKFWLNRDKDNADKPEQS